MRKKPNEVTEELRHTAWHEAGHAVAALVLGRSVVEVSIMPAMSQAGAESLAGCDPVFELPMEDRELEPSEREQCEEEIIILLAGQAMVHEPWSRVNRVKLHRPGKSCFNDSRQAYIRAERLAQPYYPALPTKSQVKCYLRWFYDRATALVHHEPHEHGARELVKELLAKRTLKGREVLRAYNVGLDHWACWARERVANAEGLTIPQLFEAVQKWEKQAEEQAKMQKGCSHVDHRQ